jgi:hypothetical protein
MNHKELYKLTKKVKEIIMYSVYPSTEPPDLNLVLTDMDSPLVNKLMGCAQGSFRWQSQTCRFSF